MTSDNGMPGAAPSQFGERGGDTEATRRLIKQFVDAWFAADQAALYDLLAEGASWHPPASIAQPIYDRSRIAAGLAGAAAGQYVKLETLRRTARAMIVDGSSAAVRVHLEAETKAGDEYVNEYTWVFECLHGRVHRITEYADTLLAARLGFVPFRKEEVGQ